MAVLLRNGVLIDGTGRGVEAGVSILIEGSSIKKIARPGEYISPGPAEEIDLQGRCVLPGLIDAHTHLCCDGGPDPMSQVIRDSTAMVALRALRNAQVHLAAGVTACRDLGAKDYVDIDLKRAIQSGLVVGPRLWVSGKCITMTGGHGHFIGREANGVEDCRRAAREQIKAGADIIKVMATGGVVTEGTDPGAPQLTEEELRAAIEEGHKAGKRTAAHAHGTEGIKNALRAGTDTLEHGTFMDEEGLDLLLRSGSFYVPTLSPIRAIYDNRHRGDIPSYIVGKVERCIEAQLRTFEKVRRAGIRIAAGSDLGMPYNPAGEGLFKELECLVEAGMSPEEAILAATATAAELLKANGEVGTVEVGKKADLLIVEKNPLEQISHIRTVFLVFKDGVVMRGGKG